MIEIIQRQADFQKKYANTNGNVMFMALVEELGEFVASTGYHDWKKSEIDKQNMIIELVDIVIFAMNVIYYERRSMNGTADLTVEDDTDLTRSLISSLGLGLYADMIATIVHVYPEVLEIIEGKQALNILRQENGYKQGTYSKLWNGREDNKYLDDVMLKSTSFEEIYNSLAELYKQHK